MKYDNYSGLLVTFGFVVQKDELDEEGLKEELSNIVDVISVQDAEEDDEVRVFLLRGTFADFISVKTKYICLAHPENNYLLFPMESYEEKRKAEELLGLR